MGDSKVSPKEREREKRAEGDHVLLYTVENMPHSCKNALAGVDHRASP
jgi:hypothetical protein